jgi:phosphate starvation-inducible PhoH-like protein
MISPPISPASVESKDVDLPRPCVEHLSARSDGPLRRMEEAVRPYRLQITPLAGGVRLIGHKIAVRLAAAMVDRIGEAFLAAGRVDDALIATTVDAVVENALKHDLAYRLEGLRGALRPMSLSQVAFMDALLSPERALIFGIGPTGTGKTHLAIAAGLSLVAQSKYKSLIITRAHHVLEGEVMTPALRAETAADAQLTPIEDTLHDLIGRDETVRLTGEQVIEIMPLGRMHGRTFNQSFIVVDEAQNMTVPKMRMVVTRLGRASCMVILGDLAQSVLRSGEPSGLAHLLGLINKTDLAVIHKFRNVEIIRNDVVASIEALYSREDGPGLRAVA